ncbi:unnamed protein product, partial [Prorocentrum cordatum]
VYLVRKVDTGEFFALKILDKAKFRAQKIVSKAHSEQFILKTTVHPFVVALHYAFQATDCWALVMEYCPNGNLLGEIVRRGNPGAAGAGAPARAEGHVPRPEARERGDALFHAKLTDFGLAKKMHNATEANTVCGSHGYVAPEILLPSKGYTLAVDVYSFGVVMYMLCSGGEQSQRRPGVRTPPMRHASLGRRLREAAGASPAPRWALREEGALELVRALTGGQDPQARPSATAAKDLRFFVRHLGGGARGGVDALLSEAAACCAPPEETSQRALQTQGSRAAGVTLPTRAATLDKNAGRACSLLRLPIPASSFSSILSHLSPSLPPTPPPPRRLASLARVRLFPVAW